MPTAGVTDSVTLTISGTTYGLNLVKRRGADQELDVNAFSPRLSSGPQQYSHLTLWSVHAQDDWSHGFGHRKFKDPQGYHKTSGSIDTRHKGVVQLATQIVASDEDLYAQAYQMIDFNDDVYACFDGSTGASVTVTNGTFEDVTANDFASWDETAGSGSVADTATAQGGSHAVKMTSGASDDTLFAQTTGISYEDGVWYKLSFYTRVDAGDAAGYYEISPDIGDALVEKTATGVTATSYTQVTKMFEGSGSAAPIRFYASGTNTDVAYFDTVTVTRIDGGIRKYESSTGTWDYVEDTDVYNAKIYCLLNNGAYLFAGVDGAQVLKSSDGATWTTTGIDAEAKDYRYMALGGGKLWASKDGDNHVHWATSIDASDWDGDQNDTNRVTVGPGDPTGANTSVPITAMQWFNGGLHVAREDGLWVIPEADPTVAYRMLDWSNEKRTTNGKGMVVWNDKLIIPVGPRLLAFTGTGISDITPPTIGQTFPYTQYGNLEAMATFGPYLYVTAQEGAAATDQEALRPSAAGNSSGWTPEPSGTSNYADVDESVADYGDTYVKLYWLLGGSNKTGTDLYALSNTSTASGKTINKVTVHALYEIFGYYAEAAGTINGVLRIGSTNYSGTALSLSSQEGWQTHSWEWTTNPADGAFTSTIIDGMEAGVIGTVTTAGTQLFVTQVWVEVDYSDTLPYLLLCFDGASWHKLGSVDGGGKCLWLSAATDDLWINDYDSTNTNYNTRYMQVQEHSFLPKDDYPTTGTHSLYLSRIHCELERVDKCLHSLWIKSNNLTSARYITAYYRVSGDTWISLGNLTQSPWEEVSLSNITGKYIDIRLDFVTDSATQSPVLEAVVGEFLARPPTIYGYNITINIGDAVVTRGGKIQKKYSARDMHTALKQARDSQVPLTYVDAYGDSHEVLITKYARLDLRKIDGGKKFAAVAQLSMADAD